MAISPESVITKFYELSFGEGADSVTFIPFEKFAGIYLNAIGYRRTDNLIYGIQPNSHDLYSVGVSGEATFITALEGIHPNHHYIAGDVSPDGSQLIIQGGNITDDKIFDSELVFIDLTPPYATRVVPIETESGLGIRCADLAFHPFTNVLYGFDGISGRLVIIDPATADIDDLAFEPVGSPDVMASLFFNAAGVLYGYGQAQGGITQSDNDRLQPNARKINTLYKLDTDTGQLEAIATGPEADGNDGCACPYNIDFHKIVKPAEVLTCSEVTYSFVIYNATSKVQSDISFRDVFPDGIRIVEILNNPFGGDIETLSDKVIELSHLTIPTGIDSLVILAELGEIAPGRYKNQAQLFNISTELGEVILSDDPSTHQFIDSTVLIVSSLNTNSGNQEISVCYGDTVTIEALSYGGVNFLWNTGITGQSLSVTEAGKYWVDVQNNCTSFTDTFYVYIRGDEQLIDLGPDIEIILGEEVFFEPQILDNRIFDYQWFETPGNSINCNSCLSAFARPKTTSVFKFEIIDESGCRSVDSIQVKVDAKARVYFPNVFSPNGDGINDRYEINVFKGIRIRSFRIYNRAGILVHQELHEGFSDQEHGWDGMLNGSLLVPQVFTYVSEIEFFDGRVEIFHGDITLVN